VGENEEDVHSFDMTLTGRRQIGSHSPARGVGPGARLKTMRSDYSLLSMAEGIRALRLAHSSDDAIATRGRKKKLHPSENRKVGLT